VTHDLETTVRRVAAHQEIGQLQSRYCHYIGLAMAAEIVDLFAKDSDEVEVEVAESGVFKGVDAPARFFHNLYKAMETPGFMTIHTAVSPVIEINADATEAKALWISPGLLTAPDPDGGMRCEWQYGRYVTDCVLERGAWRFLKFRWYRTFRAPYDRSWADAWELNTVGRNPSLPPADGPTTFHAPYRPDALVRNLPLPPEPYAD
jgi:hypothetical protein